MFFANKRSGIKKVLGLRLHSNVEAITEKSERKADRIVSDLCRKKHIHAPLFCPIVDWYYKKQINRISKADFDFSVSDDCTGCGRCEAVCSSKNIAMIENRPVFQHHCSHCVGCIQFCPQRAINYKNITQNRERYVHPNVKLQELIQYY